MAYNGSGTFLINSTGQPVVANTVISATVFNALTADLATGLSTAITKDGQTTITANIPFGNNKITGLGAGTAATDSATLGQVQSTVAKLITVTGTDTITGTMSPALTAYAAGQLFYFVANAANTGAVTINIDGLGAKSITRDGATALAAGDINSGEFVVVIYDGTRFQMINAANSFGNTTINGTLTVTGNTALQANVSITSTLSVGGTFAVTGAATLGSTLAVTGKSDLPTVSTASINAAVALITTGTVTNLTASGASIASANIGNLQFTAASIASINAGVAVITNLTATGASIASANVGMAVITAATVTGASIASANVATAVITTGTVTNLTSTAASMASANAAVALITTGTVTNLTSTSASIASANVGTAVVTGMTVTGASIASINAGVAVLSGNLTLSGGTANGVLYLNASKVATSGSALVFNGTNLGIGTTSPSNTAGFSRQVQIEGTTAALTLSGTTGAGKYTFGVPGVNAVALWDNTASAYRWYVDSSGNLGIGTTSPASKLDVAGTARISNTTGNKILQLGQSTPSANDAGSLEFQASSTNINWAIRTNWNVAGALEFSPSSSAGGTTYTTPSMLLSSSGNLGLGVTPSAWGTLKAFQINTQGSLSADGTSVHLSTNAYFDGSNWKYIQTDEASNYYQLNGQHVWRTAASGTAGNAITFTQAMTLDASGQLLLGTTSSGTFKLDIVAGNAIRATSSSTSAALYISGGTPFFGTTTNHAFALITNDTERARITAAGNFKIGGTADRGTTEGTAQLVLFNGTAPVGTLTNGVSFYSASGEANVMDAAGNATLLSPHDAETNEWIFRSKHTPTGKVLRIDVERLLRFVNDHFGLDAVKEFVE